jgi:hypothetical protein
MRYGSSTYVRPQRRVRPRLLRVSLTYRAAGSQSKTTEDSVRLPEDLAACVANCLDWGRRQQEAGEWSWYAVSVTYTQES